jgi:dTDP-4-amino-4,6-dideoxygalactose transaminase/lipopolysaccharide/colanic/teichoic acid biosynthesis glycosyltransferase
MIRFFDIIFSLIGIILLIPIIIILIIAGYFDTGSPIFCQERMGKNKNPFNLYKFRSMYLDTKSVSTHLADYDSVTRYGAVLRKSKLDELPQLFNVLKGDMSLVGPRPNLFNQDELIKEREKLGVYNAVPGITGLSQISKIDMSTPKLLSQTDAKMFSNFNLIHYFKYILITASGKGLGDRIVNNETQETKTIPFSPPFIDEDVIIEVTDSLNSGWITTGPKVNLLEKEIVKFTGVDQALCVNSWTSGAILVLKWFGVGPGDEVIIPAYTYSATAIAVLQCGATPIMVDVKSDFTIDPEKIKEAITSNTKVVMPVDFGGLMCDYDEINNIVSDDLIKSKFIPNSENQKRLNRILVMSDAAHSIGAYYKNIPSGKATDITVFSFHAVKNITTAEGGAICLNLPNSFDNSEVYKDMRIWSLNGQTKDAFTKSKAGGWKYDILFPGLKVNMPDLCAAVGLAQIKKYDSNILKERRRVALTYENFFKNKEWAECPIIEDENRSSCYHIYALRINKISEEERDFIIDELTKKGISVNVHFIPMPMLTAFKNLGYEISNYPISYDNYSREISLPIYPQLIAEKIKYISESIESCYLKLLSNRLI